MSLDCSRLPTFHIPAAVEVLTQGTYARLPACIRERLVPAEGLTPAERRATLKALNHVIRQRLVTCSLPDNMRTFKVSIFLSLSSCCFEYIFYVDDYV